MKHAFLITAYKDQDQLVFLIDALRKYDHGIFVHIDARSDEVKKEITQKYAGVNNVYVLQDSIKVHFGGFSHLEAILILLNKACKKNEYSFYHLISGQDLPLMGNEEFNRFFRKNKGKSFITHFKLPDSRWTNGGLDRIEYYQLNDVFDPKKKLFPRLNSKFIKLQRALGLKRKKPGYIGSYNGGGTWWSLSSEAVEFVVAFLEKHPAFIKGFKHTHCGEEIFFQTILLNGGYTGEIVNNDLRYINWNTKHNSCPAILDLEDKENILKSEYLFARKFASAISKDLRDELFKE